MKLRELVERLGCGSVGDPETEITGLATIELAEEGQATFLSNRKYSRFLSVTRASAIILEDVGLLPEGKAGIVSSNPYLTFAEAMWIFHPRPREERRIDPRAVIAGTAQLGESVSIGPFAVIGENVRIGDHVTIHSHCAIYADAVIDDHAYLYSHCVVREGCRIGSHVILQNNVTIGSDGFGYAKKSDNSWYKIPQTGIVVIEPEVEIGPGSVIDRATMGATIIGRGTKIDNLVQIGHGSSVGRNTLLCAQVGLAGSTRVGNEVILSGQVGAAGHLEIGDRVIATAQTGIPSSIEAGRIVSGYPAIDNRDWLKSSAVFAQLPRLQKEVRELKQRINHLTSGEEEERNR
ncbi:MAG: UDP-3-O-(3-hydroxymyristoyl)glucosamine N-acyltransferase [Blastocatellia bacterium]|nr:UDP-3-O-(3-hydroxymyristoyl)glucosamine N-acyltransferase [Blastocatellia bacterium]